MDGHGEQSSRVKLIAVVATIGLLSAALGFTAEATRLQLDDVKDIYGGGCIYPSHSGPTGLGVIAVIALLGFRVYCPGARSPCSVVQVSRYLSWMAWFVAMSFYIVGLVMIANQGKKISYGQSESYYECNVVKPGIFGAGASFALTSIILEVAYMVVTEHLAAKTPTTIDPSTQPSRLFTMC